MSRFVKEINNSPLAAERAEKDILGNKIDTTYAKLSDIITDIQIDGVDLLPSSGTVNIPLAVADDYGTSGNDGALSKEDKEKIDSYKYMYLSAGTSGYKEYANSPDSNLDVGFLTLGNYGYGQIPGFVAVGKEGQEECFFGNQGTDPAFGIYDNQSQQFTTKTLVTEDSYILDEKADKVVGATSGNLAALDDDGNLIDSGIDPSQLDGNLKQGLQGNQGTQIPSNSDLNDYTTPGNYYIISAADMVTISNTPFAQMGFASSEITKTGQSQVTVYNMNGTSSGRAMQLMYTIYSTNPGNDNSFGFWYRMSSGGSQQVWGTWKRLGERDNRFWYGYKNAANYLLITVKQISGGTAAESILISFTGNQYGVMLKLCFGIDSTGGFNGSTPTLHVIETNNWSNAAYNPLFTSGGGVAKYYYDSTNQLYYFLLKTTTTNRMMCTVESVNPGNYTFSTPSADPSWLSSASDIEKGHANSHITGSAVGSQIGSSTQPVYVDAGGALVACSVKEEAEYYNTSGTEMDYTKRCHFINDCNNGTTVKYITVDPTKLIENVAYDIGGVLLNGSAGYYIGVRYTAAGSSYKVYGNGNRNSIALSSATTETYNASIKLVRRGTNIYVIGY